jgi:hypothetical protein
VGPWRLERQASTVSNFVPKELDIVTWYYERRALSLPFFSKLGFRTKYAQLGDFGKLVSK